MGEGFRFWFALGVLCAGCALLTVMTVYHTVAVHSIGTVS